jgi:hypothetical protein
MKGDQRRFREVNLLALGAAAVTPVLVTATAATTGTIRSALTVAAVFTSLIAAVGGVVVQTLRPGIRWRLHRTLRDDLEAVAWNHLIAKTTVTVDPVAEDPWASFVQKVERVINEHNAIYAREVAGVLDSGSTGNG